MEILHKTCLNKNEKCFARGLKMNRFVFDLCHVWIVITAVVQKVNGLIQSGEYGRLFAVVQFAGRQWKVTNEDLILIENHIDVECGDGIRLEKVCPHSLLNTAKVYSVKSQMLLSKFL